MQCEKEERRQDTAERKSKSKTRQRGGKQEKDAYDTTKRYA
jgi:hypothetical protein